MTGRASWGRVQRKLGGRSWVKQRWVRALICRETGRETGNEAGRETGNEAGRETGNEAGREAQADRRNETDTEREGVTTRARLRTPATCIWFALAPPRESEPNRRESEPNTRGSPVHVAGLPCIRTPHRVCASQVLQESGQPRRHVRAAPFRPQLLFLSTPSPREYAGTHARVTCAYERNMANMRMLRSFANMGMHRE
eukprot:6214809-Pleurochrysis_carterae.AAC.1